MHHYSRHIGDYRKDTPHLSTAQHGAYALLLDFYYASEKPLPDDLDMLCRICGAVRPDERKAVAFVLSGFFVQDSTGWRQKRCDREISIYQARSASGRKGADGKWRPDNQPDNQPDGKPDGKPDNKPDSNQRAREPVTNNQEPITRDLSGFAFPPEWSAERKASVSAFIVYRRRVLKKPLKPETFPAWCAKYADYDDATLRAAINDSMAEGYQGVFPDKHLSRPRRPLGGNGSFEKKESGGGPAPHPLAAPPCAEWKTIARELVQQVAQAVGEAPDFTWLDEANWSDLPSDDRQAVLDEHRRRNQANP